MKKEKNSSKKKIKKLIIICCVLIFALLLLLTLLNTIEKNKEQEEQIITQEEQEEAVTNYVRNKGEKERMQVYLADYIQLIEQKKYSKAYEKLYPKFKENYFPSEEMFTIYAQQNYSDLMMIKYDDIQRQGNYYILSVTITNLDEIETEKIQKFVIYENGLNDYYLSFQAK